jgi:hypothetical protein
MDRSDFAVLNNIARYFVGLQSLADEKHLREWIRRHLVYYEDVARSYLPGPLLCCCCPQVATTLIFISSARHIVEGPCLKEESD